MVHKACTKEGRTHGRVSHPLKKNYIDIRQFLSLVIFIARLRDYIEQVSLKTLILFSDWFVREMEI